MKKKTKGYILIASPFVAIAGIGISLIGVLPTLGVFGIAGVICYVIALGVNLIED